MEEQDTDWAVITVSLDDPAHFGLIFDRHYDPIHRFLARRVGGELADDLAATVFLTAFQSRARFRPDGAGARPWLYGIATNVLRRHTRTEVRRLRAIGRLPRPDQVEFDGDAVAGRIDAQRGAAAVGEALARLSEGERSVLLLVAWADLTYEQVALALDIPIGTVRSRLSRARARVRELIDPVGQYEDERPIPSMEKTDG